MKSLTTAIALLVSLLLQSAVLADSRCDKCGGRCQVVRRLVCSWEVVDTPDYVCKATEVFLPNKGRFCYEQYRCDTWYDVKKVRTGCGDPKCGCQGGEETVVTCRMKCGCKKLSGACPGGCAAQGCARKPDNVVRRRVPVYRWVVEKICCGCPGTKSS